MTDEGWNIPNGIDSAVPGRTPGRVLGQILLGLRLHTCQRESDPTQLLAASPGSG